ncbi:toxin glutamine deamidase domain-containing protein [Dactylosporangium sp. NPDC051541]|uniref:WXG100-like domain-containing protein n=1 Tax=Dactylosporangium sp. NPDC051541 TaxID=3363977 RepID=UPI003796BD1C
MDAVCFIGAGSAWPDGNEDHLRDLAHAWQELGTELNGLLNNADTVAMQVSQAWGGDAGEAFNTYWNALAVGPNNGLAQITDIALNYSAAAENAAMEIEYAKLVLVITLVITLITVIICQILAAFTFGGSEAAAGAAVATARTIAGRVLQRLIAWVGKGMIRKLFVKFVIHEVQNIVLSVGTDWLAQEIQIAEGHRKELDTDSLMHSLVAGAITGALTFPLNFVHLPIKSRWPRVAANTAVHGAANTLIMPASMMLTTGFMSGDWSWSNITHGITWKTFVGGAAMGGTMGGIGAIRTPKGGAHGVETPQVDGNPAAGAGETGARGIDTAGPEGLSGDPSITGLDTGTGGDGLVTSGDRSGSDVTGSDYTPGDGQSLAPTSDNAAGGSVAAPVDTNTGAGAHNTGETGGTQTGDTGVNTGSGDPVTQHSGGDPVTQQGGGDPVVQRAGETGTGSSGSDGGVHVTTESTVQAGANTGVHAEAGPGAHTETGTGAHTGTETGTGAHGQNETTGAHGREGQPGPVAEHPAAVVGTDRPAGGAEGARTTDTGPRTTEAGTRATDTGARTTEGTGRGTETTGRGTEGTGRGGEGTGRGSESTGRGTEGTGRGNEGRTGDGARTNDGPRTGEGARGDRGNDGARTTDGGRTREQNQTNGSFRAPERTGESGARPADHVPTTETGARPGEHVQTGETGARPGENGARPGDHSGQPVHAGDHTTQPGEHTNGRPGDHADGRTGDHSGQPGRDGGSNERDGSGRHRAAEEPVAVFVPMPRLDDMPVRIGGGEPGGVQTRPVSVHEGAGPGERGGHGTDTAPPRDHGPGGERDHGPGGGDDNPPPPPGDRPGGGGSEEPPASKPSSTRTADGTRSYEGPPRHFEGEPGSPEAKAATDRSARDLADAVRDQQQTDKIGEKNRVRVAGAMLTPDEPTIRSHTSARPMKHPDGSTTHLDVHPEAKRVLDDIKAAAARDPEQRLGINHGKCAEVVLVSDKLFELEAQWREAGEPGGDFPAWAREQMRDGVVGTHWVGDGKYQEHGEYAPPCDSCGPFIEDFGLHSIDPNESAHAPTTGPHEPTGPRPGEHDTGPAGTRPGEHDTGPAGTRPGEHETGTGEHETGTGEHRPGEHETGTGEHRPGEHETGTGERPPETLGRVDEQTVAETRSSEVRGPSDKDVRALNDKFPRDEHGNPLKQPDVRKGDFAQEYNDGGHKVPGRNNNCGEVSMATLANHRGEPTVAGSMRDPNAGGEHGAADRISRWTGGEWEMQGHDARGFEGVERQLREAGPGSGSIVVIKWGDTGEGHAFNALNIHGDIVWVDMQRGIISDHGPMYHDNVAGVWSITVNAHGDPLVPLGHGPGAHATTEGAGGRPHIAGEDTRNDFFNTYDLHDEVAHTGTTVKVEMYRGIEDGKLHLPGDPKGTYRIEAGNLRDKHTFIDDWHTAERQQLLAQAETGPAVPHEVRPTEALPKDPVEGVHDSSQEYHDKHDAADRHVEARKELLKKVNDVMGPGRKDLADLRPGEPLKKTMAELRAYPGGHEVIGELKANVDAYHKDMNGVRVASGEAAMHAGLGVAHHEAMTPTGRHEGVVVEPEHVTVKGDPKSAKPNELDIIALRYDETRVGVEDQRGYNRLDIWEAKGGSGDLGSRYVREIGGRVEQGTGWYLKWMLENDPNMLRLYVEHPGLLDAIRSGEVEVAYHKVTTTRLDRAPQIDPADPHSFPRDPQTGKPVVLEGTSRTEVETFEIQRTKPEEGHNYFEQGKLNPNFKVLDLIAEREAAARGELPPRSLSGHYDPEVVHGVHTGEAGRVWHAELPPPMTWHGAEPHAVEAHARGLLEGAADPRTWVDGAPPRIVIHAEHGIDAATARLIEHTRIEFTQPDPEHPVPEPRITVEGPRQHDPAHAIELPRETIEGDRRAKVPYFTEPEDIARIRVRIEDGRLYDAEGLPMHGEYIYAVDPRTQEIHAYPFGADNTRHSSLFAGGKVDAAGTLNVENGRITSVDNASGHYRPIADHVGAARDAFAARGADLGEAQFKASGGHGPTEHSMARGAEAFDRAVAELNRPGAIDGVTGVHRIEMTEGSDPTGRSAMVEVRLSSGEVVQVDGAAVRDFLQARRPDGPDAGLPEFARNPHTTSDADLAFQGADQLRDRIMGELGRDVPEPVTAAEPRPPARPDHVLTELDRLLAERTGEPPLHDTSGEPIPGPRNGNDAVGSLRNLSDEHIAAIVAAAGLTGEPAARMAGELAARRDAAIERHGRPPYPHDVEGMARTVRTELGYSQRDPAGREVYDTLRRRAYQHTGGLAHGVTVREAARAVDAAVVEAGGQPRYERILNDFLDSPEGRAYHEGLTELDLATNHQPHFELEHPAFTEVTPEHAAEQVSEHAAGRSPEDERALSRYTAGVSSDGVNHYLRTGEARGPQDRADAFRIQHAMRETVTDLRLHGQVELRHFGITELHELPRLVDGHLRLDAFTHLDGEVGAHISEGRVQVVVEAPKGTAIAWVGREGEFGPESHALLGAGARVHVVELRHLDYGQYELRLRYEGYEDPAPIAGSLHDGGPPPGDVPPPHEPALPAGDREPAVPADAETAQAVAHAEGIDLRGVEIRVAEDPALLRYLDEQGVTAVRPPEEGGRVLVLGPAAFADHQTLAATLREHEGSAGDPHQGGEGLRLDRPGADDLGLSAGGRHRAGDEAGQWDRGPGDGAGDRGGEPAGPARGLDHPGAGAHDTEPGGRGRDAEGGGDPTGGVHVPRDTGPRDDSGGGAGPEPGGAYLAEDFAAIMGLDSAAGVPGDHPGGGGAHPGGGAHYDPVGPRTAPDPAQATLEAHQLVQERIAPHSPELAGVVEKLLDDTHALNVTNSLRNPEVRDLVLRHIEELARGDALARYGGDLHLFLEDNPGRGPLYAEVPEWVNKVTVEGTEYKRMDLYVAEMKASDPALSVGPHPTPEERVLVEEYADRLREKLKPAVDQALQEVAAEVRRATDGPVDYNSRGKDAEGLFDKVSRMQQGRENAPGRPWYRVGDIIDAVGARITVPDTRSLWHALELIRERFGVGDGGRIVEVDNMYASPKSKSPEYRVIPLTIGIEVEGHKYAFELQLTTLRASIAADIEHNSLYKPYVALSAADAQAVHRAFREAAARDQLEDSSP